MNSLLENRVQTEKDVMFPTAWLCHYASSLEGTHGRTRAGCMTRRPVQISLIVGNHLDSSSSRMFSISAGMHSGVSINEDTISFFLPRFED
jgi:hypothetical protein